jgi:superkiller protein 3
VKEAITWYRKAIALDPKDTIAHTNLGNALAHVGQVDEAIACQREAIALDPQNAKAHTGLGEALRHKGRLDEAIASHRQAIALDPKLAVAHQGLGTALCSRGKVDEGIACLEKAIALDPKSANAHTNLGLALARNGRLDEAIDYYKKAVALDPKDALAHNSLGALLCDFKRNYDGAIACYKKAIALDPNDAAAHYNLGNALNGKGKVDEAIASYKKAIELDPNRGEPHCNLAAALQAQGRFAESLAAFQRGHKLGSKQSGWNYPSAAWVRQAEQLAALEAKLPAVLEGEHKPADTAERLGLVRVCLAKKLHHAASRLFADAFAADAKLADDLNAAHRFNAACSAALAANGLGHDADKLDASQRARLRQQALDWLRADLSLLASGEVGRSRVVRILSNWQKDGNLAGIRDKAALAKLPAEQRTACEKFWSDVAALLEKAQTPTKKDER